MNTKVLTVIVDGENQLIKYSKTRNAKNEIQFDVETTIPRVEKFIFWIEGGRAAYLKTGNPRDSTIEQIVPQIGKADSKG